MTREEPSAQNFVTGNQFNAPVTGSQTFTNVFGSPTADQKTTIADLRNAIGELRAEFEALQATSPDAVSGEAAQDTSLALGRLSAEAAKPEPDKGVIRRWIDMIKGAVGPVAELAGGVAAIETIFSQLS